MMGVMLDWRSMGLTISWAIFRPCFLPEKGFTSTRYLRLEEEEGLQRERRRGRRVELQRGRSRVPASEDWSWKVL